ncbi:seryl-tRNA synthetase, partial [Auriscalpium vulgare]
MALCLRRAVSLARCRYSTQTDVSTSTLPKPRIDYRDISENVVYKSHNAFNRKAPISVGAVQDIDRLYRARRELSNTLNSKRHAQSLMGERIRQAGKDVQAKNLALEEAKALKVDVLQLGNQLSGIEDKLLSLALAVPNDTHPLAPLGPESAALELSTHGPDPIPSSPSRDHVSIAHALDLLDLESGATTTGSSWYYLVNEAALLEMALTNYGLSVAIKHGFTPVTTPDVVRSDIAKRCGFHPRDHATDPPVAQMYHLSGSADPSSSSHPELVLAGTAEIPLAGMFANKVFEVKQLPRKVVGLGRAFRAEAGARGADTRGLYRVHQFTKLELFAVTEAHKSEELMEELREVQVEIFDGLGFPFRVLDMPSEELGASAYRKYDMEAWMPGRGSWGEISSTSNCTDYQARRLHIRYRPNPPPSSDPEPPSSQSSGLPFAHTLNGTAVAVPRLIVALLENGARFNETGDVVGLNLPSVLKPFWLGNNGRRNIVQWT